MQSLLTVNNNVALFSITIAPSTWVASLTLALVFLYLYLPPIPPIRLNYLFFKRTRNQTTHPATTSPQYYQDPYHQKALPDLPTRALLTDYSHSERREKSKSTSKSSASRDTRRRKLYLPSPTSSSSPDHEPRPPRRQSSRLPAALPAAHARDGPQELRLPVGALWLPQRERGGRGRERQQQTTAALGSGRLGRWLQSAGVAAARKRRPE
jgi:hypothetical protein